MKLKLLLRTTTQNGNEVVLKLNIPPSKYTGLMDFIRLTLNQEKDVSVAFEKITKKSGREDSKVSGMVKPKTARDTQKQLADLEQEIKILHQKRKKQLQKRKHK